jgi:hypothetical protein
VPHLVRVAGERVCAWRADNVKIGRRGKPRDLQQNSKAHASGASLRRALLTQHPSNGLIDVYAALLPELDFKPREHVHYQEAVLHMVDSLPKHKDLPKAAGGSGVLLPS